MTEPITSKFNFILRRLEPWTISRSPKGRSPRNITRIEFFAGQNVLRAETIYIVPDSTVLDALQESVIYPGAIVLICDKQAEFFVRDWAKECQLVALDCDFVTVYNLMNHILETYRSWERFAQTNQTDSFSFSRILRAGEAEFHKRLYMLDRENRLIVGDEAENTDAALRSFVRLLSGEKIGTEVGGNDERPSCEIFRDSQGSIGYFSKIYVNGRYEGQLMLLDSQDDEDDLPTMVLQIARCIAMCLEQATIRQNRTQDSLESLLDSILHQELRDSRDYDDAFRDMPYPIRRNCRCLLLRFEQENTLSRPFAYLQAELRKAFPDTNMAVYQNEVIILLSSDGQTAGLSEQETRRLEEILDAYSACAAVGSSFSRPCFLRTQYLMVRKLLRIGMAVRFRDTERIFIHEHYSIYLMLDMAMEGFSREYRDTNYAFLLHTDVVELARYDRQHRTNLTDLLHLYLMYNRNINSTAEATYLHRNTVRNKLRLMRTIMNGDPDDPSLQYQMLLSCSLMRYSRLVLNRDLLESGLDYALPRLKEQTAE